MPDTTYNPMTAYNYGCFVQAAYNMFKSDENNLRPTPKDIPQGYDLVLYITAVDHVFEDKDEVFYGFIAKSSASPTEYVIAIRGTELAIEWIMDAEFLPTVFTPVPGAGKVEDGFFNVYKTLSGLTPDGQVQDLNAYVKNTIGGQRLICAGHSLGASVANMLALDMAVNDGATDLTLYVFAPPQTGDGAFQNLFNQKVPYSYQVCNLPDIVPHLPPVYKTLNKVEEIDSLRFSNIKLGVVCFHELMTYLYTLNQNSEFGLGQCAKS